MEMEAPIHSLEMEVRDYECDLQGIVNNAIYQNYLEHARHTMLRSLGVDFADLTRRRIHLVLVRAELDYRASLTGGDRFRIDTRVERIRRLKFVFEQCIVRLSDQRPILQARMTATGLNPEGRPEIPPEVDALVPWTGNR